MTNPEQFDLNEALAAGYMDWQKTYLVNMPKPDGESVQDYASRMCCIAYMEGAKRIQTLLQQSLAETVMGAAK
jgi:hypothetical protein